MERGRFDWMRKLAALLLVLSSVTLLMIGVGSLVEGHWWGLLGIPVAVGGILLALKITPEGGTTGYCDQNI